MPSPKKPSAPLGKFCPRCYRPEATIADCPNPDFPGHVCPDPVEAEPGATVNLQCGPCQVDRIVPVKDLITGHARTQLPMCRRDNCACKAV